MQANFKVDYIPKLNVMKIEHELAVLLVIQLTGSAFFARFEVETPALRKIFKWLMIDIITVGLYFLVGHFALIFPLIIIAAGTVFHFRFCKQNNIDPLKATPRKKYYEFRGWKWEE